MAKIEGFSIDELLALPDEDLDALVLAAHPVVVRIGTAEILGECSRHGSELLVDLAHIDGGGEGALPTLVAFIKRYARSREIQRIRWAVRATNCARPNMRLRHVLERRGFLVRDVSGLGECYYRETPVDYDGPSK